jgi:hypothetical protein
MFLEVLCLQHQTLGCEPPYLLFLRHFAGPSHTKRNRRMPCRIAHARGFTELKGGEHSPPRLAQLQALSVTMMMFHFVILPAIAYYLYQSRPFVYLDLMGISFVALILAFKVECSLLGFNPIRPHPRSISSFNGRRAKFEGT